MNLGQTANNYAELGYAVFPLIPGGKTPFPGSRGLLEATTDAEQVEKWWTATPDANIGIATRGLVVIDVDTISGCANPWLADQPDKLMELAAAPMSLTPRGGRHYWFKQPPYAGLRNTASRLAPSVDTRADGGYVVAPNSVRDDGTSYRWAGESIEAGPADLRQPPFWLLKMLCEPGATVPKQKKGTSSNRIPEGQRNAALVSLAASMRQYGLSAVEIHAALERVNLDRCSPPVPADEVRKIAEWSETKADNPNRVAEAEHHAEQIAAAESDDDESAFFTDDPGPVSDDLLHVPGFVAEYIDHCLDTAPRPNLALAFCGAMTLQAFLCARKIRERGDIRSNIYLLGLAQSGAGKDWPRTLNSAILDAIGRAGCIGETFSSAEGIEDALMTTPSMLFQTDEIDDLLLNFSRRADPRYDGIMNALLKLTGAARHRIVRRKKANDDGSMPSVITQPSLVLFGTAIPQHYYAALTDKMITKGFFARTLITEAGPRSAGREAKIKDIPERILETAQWWNNFAPAPGNIAEYVPNPATIPTNDDAAAILADKLNDFDALGNAADIKGDIVGSAIWTRAGEHVKRLALIYAASACPQIPVIDHAAADWAINFTMRALQRMYFMARSNVSDNPFHESCLRAKQKLAAAPGKTLPHSRLLKLMRVDSQTLARIVLTLSQQGDIATEETRHDGAGRPLTTYRLLRM